MGAVRFSKGQKVVTPDGLKGTVRTVEAIKTGKPGRPAVEVTVKTKNGNEVFKTGQLSPVVAK